ncbi:MAG: UDP-N-acetylmuramoyl-L-alanyl-D-glutamate--2,6-diaminopimelate ligase [Candidatus Obscuribacterales bacterium]|nr:UDP-N-acetylmuramoyl-L-alanyl-D-glutamate--2,6-diaminopimelate ligase [Candidatus Obscuribacterales bacterium]
MPSVKARLLELGAHVYPKDAFSELHFESLSYDSRHVKPGSAFFCLPGEKTDGNTFIDQAISSGAKVIISEQERTDLPVPMIVVPDIRLALGLISTSIYDEPSKKLRLIGVTGTNGKTTTTHLIEHIFQAAGQPTGLIGTLGSRYPGHDSYGEAKHTTPQAPELQKLLSDMVDNGCRQVAMEVSSHSLALKRVAGCEFAVACLTNISQDHLDFHKTMDHYWRTKRTLFESLSASNHKSKVAVINYDEKLAPEFIAACDKSVRTLTYGFAKEADVHIQSLTYASGLSKISLATPFGAIELEMRLVGQFNMYNMMAALTVCLAEGVDIELAKKALSEFSGVPGRFEVITSNYQSVTSSVDSTSPIKEPLCIVDYAHTPDGLENVLKTAAALKGPKSKLYVVFGCGGDRDSSKRPQMGKIAENLADVVLVTSDNPRSENPQEIIANILTGIKHMKNVQVEVDRAAAIKMAVEQASSEDIILVAGKGHENYQLVMNQVLSFDDRIEVQKALAAKRAKH